MTVATKTLVIDDEFDQMDDVWFMLRRQGFELDFAVNLDEARQKYTRHFYELIIIDAMLGRDFDMAGNAGRTAVPSGVEIYHEIRKYVHAQNIPLVILTNYLPRVHVYKLEDSDPYLKVLAKALGVPVLAKAMRSLLEDSYALLEREEQHSRQVWQQTSVAEEGWPNKHPLFIRGQGRYARVMVHFVPCQLTDTLHPLDNDPGGTWHFEAKFRQLMTDPHLVSHVLKMVPRYNPHHEPLGLLYINPHQNPRQEGPNEYEDILFETAPRLRHGVANRKNTECGVALTARFLLECLYRSNLTVHEFRHGKTALDEDQTLIRPIVHGDVFLRHLGFQPAATNPQLLSASRQSCEQILQRVCHSPEHWPL